MRPVISLKLSTGEEVIGSIEDYIELNNEDFKIKNPRRIEVAMSRDGLAGLSLIPFMIGCPEGEVVIEKSHVVAYVKSVPKQLEDGYLQQTSGIQLAL